MFWSGSWAYRWIRGLKSGDNLIKIIHMTPQASFKNPCVHLIPNFLSLTLAARKSEAAAMAFL